MTWIDVSVAIRDGMVHWPDNPPIAVAKTMDMAQGAPANVSKIALGVHTATHVDAPCHFKPGAAAVDDLPFEAGVGPARVLEIRDPERITVAELDPTRSAPVSGSCSRPRTRHARGGPGRLSRTPSTSHPRPRAGSPTSRCARSASTISPSAGSPRTTAWRSTSRSRRRGSRSSRDSISATCRPAPAT